jgi:hypothetical protein
MSVRDDAFQETTVPRSNGAPSFDAPWQARAHALVVRAVEALELPWDEFRDHLMRAIEEDADREYWESWVVAFDRLLRGLEMNYLSEITSSSTS